MSALQQDKGEALWHALEERPFAYDLFNLLRKVEALHARAPRLGYARRPQQEPLRIGQEPSSAFAPAAIARLNRQHADTPPKVCIYSFGLFGPNGPLPLALTEYARERTLHHGDQTLVEFVDLFHHRLTLLFYRAWADAQSTVSLDRPRDDAFTRYVSSLLSYGFESLRERDSVPDHARWNHAGHLVRQTRNAEGLSRILSDFFKVPVAVEEFVSRWLPLPDEQRTRLGALSGAQLGIDAVAGNAVWDRQHRFRLKLGPMNRAAYEALLPTGGHHRKLLDWLRTYIGIEFAWDVRLVLRAEDVPRAGLDGGTRLGWSTWMGAQERPRDRDDLVLDPERLAAGQSRRAEPAL
ncbi:type VI secretion system baseplate subunit TssG [Pseudomonas sp. RIT-PI-AD]|uniref:type VI secretion system baseplate subunit TssG n=1 Tax=Pseudomonas sp. RIT-PI-AD TaxID=3035294 RepID=UPI0021DAD214|nr:type VI secretion system baseplate subunit TssG [Pseudomonas sp. RIT-PI-AD]